MFAHLAKNTAAHGRSHIGDAVAYVRKGKRNNSDWATRWCRRSFVVPPTDRPALQSEWPALGNVARFEIRNLLPEYCQASHRPKSQAAK
jgi:hypothetical protein